MLVRLMILMTLLPMLELYFIIQVHGFLTEALGPGPALLATFTSILITGVLGAYLAKSQGLAIWNRLQGQLRGGKLPTDEVIQGALVLFGGGLLLTPGFLTDFIGFSFIIPGLRALWIKLARRHFSNLVSVGGWSAGRTAGTGFRSRPASGPLSTSGVDWAFKSFRHPRTGGDPPSSVRSTFGATGPSPSGSDQASPPSETVVDVEYNDADKKSP